MNRITITQQDIRKAGRFYDTDGCLIATALKRIFPKKKTTVAYDVISIDDKVYKLPTKSVDLIADLYDEKAVYSFNPPHYPDILEGLTLEYVH